MKDKLKLCRKCGGPAKIKTEIDDWMEPRGTRWYTGVCLKCGEEGWSSIVESEAIQEWNIKQGENE